jgi:hypothetical protein
MPADGSRNVSQVTLEIPRDVLDSARLTATELKSGW